MKSIGVFLKASPRRILVTIRLRLDFYSNPPFVRDEKLERRVSIMSVPMRQKKYEILLWIKISRKSCKKYLQNLRSIFFFLRSLLIELQRIKKFYTFIFSFLINDVVKFENAMKLYVVQRSDKNISRYSPDSFSDKVSTSNSNLLLSRIERYPSLMTTAS